MSLGIENVYKIQEFLANIAIDIPECGFVSASPLEFLDKADLFSNFNPKTTQREIETTLVGLTTVRQIRPVSRPEVHGGVFEYLFSYNLFREYSRERLDETETPDDFRKRVQKSRYEFDSAIEQLTTVLEEETDITDAFDFTGVVEAVAQMERSEDFIRENEPADFILDTNVTGFTAELPVLVRVRMEDC